MAATQDPNFGLYHTWNFGENGWDMENNENLKKLGCFMFLRVLSTATTSQPGTPTLGDRYILPPSATGIDWAGNDGKLALYQQSGWVFYNLIKGVEFWADDVGQKYFYNGSSLVLIGSLYGQYANDTAAASGGVPVNGMYVNLSTGALHVRLS